MTELDTLVFVKKYQPKSVKDVIGEFVPKVLKYMEKPLAMPNFLFESNSPGTGKTTLARAIINDLGCDKLILNSSKDRTLSVVREQISNFVSSESMTKGVKRCVFLDEFDGMPAQTQDSLRNVMETYDKNCFFILTCNSINKVIDPIRSRCIEISFKLPAKIEIAKYLKNICETENIKFDAEGIKKLIEVCYPSIRDMVKTLQDHAILEKPLTNESVVERDELFNDTWTTIKDKKLGTVRERIMKKIIYPEEFNTWLFVKAFEEALTNKTISASSLGSLLNIFAQNERDFKIGCNPNIVFLASMFKVMNAL